MIMDGHAMKTGSYALKALTDIKKKQLNTSLRCNFVALAPRVVLPPHYFQAIFYSKTNEE